MKRVIALAASVCCASGAFAGSFPLSMMAPVFNAAGGPAFTATAGNTVAVGRAVALIPGAAARFAVSDAVVVAGRAGALSLLAVESVPASAIGLIVAACVLSRQSICAPGSQAATALSDFRMSFPSVGGGIPTDGTLLEWDSGTATTLQPVYACSLYTGSYNGNGTDAALLSACSLAAADLAKNSKAGYAPYNYSFNVTACNAPGVGNQRCTVHGHITNATTGALVNDYTDSTGSGGWSSTTVTQCPASVDFYNPAYSIPAGQPTGYDGLCPTARSNHTALQMSAVQSTIDAKSSLASSPFSTANAPSHQAKWDQATIDALNSGQVVPAASSTLTISGPATQTGTPVVTSSTSGTTTTITTATPTYTYTYSGDTVSYTTNNTTTTNVGGTLTNTTTTNVVAPTAQDPTDPCTSNPGRAGCAQLGTVPSADPIPQSQVSVSYTPTVFASATGCPPPISFSMFGKAHAISYQPLCDWLAPIRLIFLAVGAAVAAMIFMEGLKA